MALIYVINLDKDIERMASIKKNIHSFGLNFIRIPAILGKSVPDWKQLVDEKLYSARNRRTMPRLGEVGCYLSHLKAMETFLLTNEPWCVILEDDTEVLPDFLKVLEKLNTRKDWDLVKLFNFHSGMPFRMRKLTQEHKLVLHFTRTTSSAAYVINRKAAEVLLKTMLPISEQVDHALDRPWETHLQIRGIRPMPVALAPVAVNTTIDYSERAGNRLSFSRWLRLFISRATKEIQRFMYSLKEMLSWLFKY